MHKRFGILNTTLKVSEEIEQFRNENPERALFGEKKHVQTFVAQPTFEIFWVKKTKIKY